MSASDPSSPRVDTLPAFDRVQDWPGRDRRDARPLPRWLWALLALLVFVGVGVGAWFIWPTEEGAGNLLVELLRATEEFRPELATTRPDEAAGLVLDELGWSVAPPDLPALALVGAGVPIIASLRPTPAATPVEVRVPAFRYEGAEGEGAVVFVYDYILLDRLAGTFDLPDATYAVLSEPSPVDSRALDGMFVVTWRERAMLLSAVTDDEAVAERIRQAVAA